MLSLESTIDLNDGNKMPILGFGVFEAEDGAECENAVSAALDVGYRHIDTAWIYGNEASVGRALESSPVPREEIFLTTKTPFIKGVEDILPIFESDLGNLKTDYVDLYLIHWPMADEDLPRIWEILEDLKEQGRCRSIGISNFSVERLSKVFLPIIENSTTPVVNQVEMHVFCQQRELRELCNQNGIRMEAYSPLARAHFLDNPVLNEIAVLHGKTPAQVMIRFLLQNGITAIPKSTHAERIKQNADVFDFELDEDQMEKLRALDEQRFVRDWTPPGYY